MRTQSLHFRWAAAVTVIGALALIAICHLDVDRLRGVFPAMYSPPWVGKWLGVAAMTFLVLGVLGACWLARHPHSRIRNILLVTWTLGPPLYFVLSYHVVFRYFGVEAARDHYWNSQKVYASLWAGVAALLALVVSDKLDRRGRS